MPSEQYIQSHCEGEMIPIAGNGGQELVFGQNFQIVNIVLIGKDIGFGVGYDGMLVLHEALTAFRVGFNLVHPQVGFQY